MDENNGCCTLSSVPKWLVIAIGLLLALFLVFGVAIKYQDLTDRLSGKATTNTMSFTAEGKVKATPDLATVNLGVVTQGKTSGEVQSENSKKINKIIEFIKQQGISKDDISTTQFTITPIYNYNNGKNDITGYESRQTVTVLLRGVDKSNEALGIIIAKSTEQGVNEISNVSLSFDDPENLRQRAREQAVEKAKVRALELAKASGVKLGRILSVNQSGSNFPQATPYGAYGMGGGYGAMGSSASPNVEPGMQDIIESMTLTFELK